MGNLRKIHPGFVLCSRKKKGQVSRHGPAFELAIISDCLGTGERHEAVSAWVNQYESDEITSPPLSVTKPRRVTTLTESLRNATWPSPNRTLAPPGWNEAISSLLP